MVTPDKIKKICPRCGGDIGEKGRCLSCKKAPMSMPYDKRYLRPYTFLDEKYVIMNVLGAGGFGVTYSAYDINTREHFAIKEFFPENFTHRLDDGTVELDSPDYKLRLFTGLNRFAAEARNMLSLKDIHFVAHVVNLFSANNTSYIVMEFANGITLHDYISKHRMITVKKIVKMLSTVFISIRSLHSKGLVHCDISPENIVIYQDVASLIDFGAAKAINNKSVDVTMTVKHGYTPPELYKINAKPSPEADVYALGATLYYCIFRRNPPQATNEGAMRQVFKDLDSKFKRTPEMANAIKKALAYDKNDRYSSVIDFLTEIAE